MLYIYIHIFIFNIFMHLLNIKFILHPLFPRTFQISLAYASLPATFFYEFLIFSVLFYFSLFFFGSEPPAINSTQLKTSSRIRNLTNIPNNAREYSNVRNRSRRIVKIVIPTDLIVRLSRLYFFFFPSLHMYSSLSLYISLLFLLFLILSFTEFEQSHGQECRQVHDE